MPLRTTNVADRALVPESEQHNPDVCSETWNNSTLLELPGYVSWRQNFCITDRAENIQLRNYAFCFKQFVS